MTDKLPPQEIQEAAAKVDRYLAEQTTVRLSTEAIAKLSFRERLDYARRFDQKSMPEWRDPRTSAARSICSSRATAAP